MTDANSTYRYISNPIKKKVIRTNISKEKYFWDKNYRKNSIRTKLRENELFRTNLDIYIKTY